MYLLAPGSMLLVPSGTVILPILGLICEEEKESLKDKTVKAIKLMSSSVTVLLSLITLFVRAACAHQMIKSLLCLCLSNHEGIADSRVGFKLGLRFFRTKAARTHKILV